MSRFSLIPERTIPRRSRGNPCRLLRNSSWAVRSSASRLWEADGTLEGQQTLLVLVEVRGGGLSGLGYSYAGYGSAYVTKELLADIVENKERSAFGSRTQCGLPG